VTAASGRKPVAARAWGLGFGFGFVKRYARMRVGLPAPVSAAAPPGIVVRTPNPDDEAELRAIHAVQQNAVYETDIYQRVLR
jgi:hypothetical protein